MTALTAMQQEWVEKTEAREKTGVLLWDITAAYDTLDAELLCKKNQDLLILCEDKRMVQIISGGENPMCKDWNKDIKISKVKIRSPQGGSCSLCCL
jgi:hypothetical protein